MEGAFLRFGGVPTEVLFDNPKALVEHHDATTREVRFNLRLHAFARYWGFTPRACAPYRARTKGKDERGVGYVKRNAIACRRFENWRRSRRIWTGGRARLPIGVCMARPAWLLRLCRRGRGASPSGRTGAVWAAAGSRAQGPGGLRNRPGHEQLLGSLAADRGERPRSWCWAAALSCVMRARWWRIMPCAADVANGLSSARILPAWSALLRRYDRRRRISLRLPLCCGHWPEYEALVGGSW